MNDAVIVGDRERVRQLGRDRQRRRDPQTAASVEQLADGDPLHVLHGQEAHPRPLAEVVRPHDVLVREPPSQPDLILESRQQRGVGQQLGTEGLDGDLLVQLQIARPVHGAHPPAPEHADDLVAMRKALPDPEIAAVHRRAHLTGIAPRNPDLLPQIAHLVAQPLFARFHLYHHVVEHPRQAAQLVGAPGERGEGGVLIRPRLHRRRRVDHLVHPVQVFHLLVAQPLLLQAGVDPRPQQHRVERLVEIILGAPFDAPDDSRQLVQRRNHHDGNVTRHGTPLQRLEHFVAVQLRHPHVEQHEVESFLPHQLQRTPAVLGRLHRMSLAREAAAQHLPVVLDVVDHEDSRLTRATRAVLGGGRTRVAAGARPFGTLPSRRVADRDAAHGGRVRRSRQPPCRGEHPPQILGQRRILLGVGGAEHRGDRRDDPLARLAQRLVQPGDVAAAHVSVIRPEHRGDQRQDVTRGGDRLLEMRAAAGKRRSGRILGQHLGVPDDVIDGRPEVVSQLRQRFVRQRCRSRGWWLAHWRALPPNSASIFPSRRASSIGLVS